MASLSRVFSALSGVAATVLALCAGHGCGGPPEVAGPSSLTALPPAGPNDHVKAVATLMCGSYSSAAQAEADPAYFDVRLHIVPIWTDRADGPWLYVEQAMANALHQPYRQRVYRLVDHGAGVVESIVFTLPGNPLTFAGAWQDSSRLNALDPALLQPRMGCSVRLRPAGPDRYVGSTHGSDCASDLRGAAYATSEVTLSPGLLESWDRGFDAAGQQVWGAKAGPYRFVKIQEASE